MSFLNFAAVGLGGCIGAMLRYAISLIPFRPAGDFPLWTLVTNVIGAFVIGAAVTLAARWGCADSRWMLLLKTGVCGGFTTFSTFSLEAVQLLQGGKIAAGLVYILLSLLLCLGALVLAQLVFSR